MGLGSSTITAILGHTKNSTVMLAAFTIVGNIDKLATVAIFGLAATSAVVIGNEIGAGNREKVYSVGKALCILSTIAGLISTVLMLGLLPTVLIPYIFPLFKLSPDDIQIATVMAITIFTVYPLRSFDCTNVVGILRGGGDVKASALIDILPLWCVAIPLTALTALVFNAPVWLIFLAYQSETLVKMPIGLIRLRSGKWIHDLTDVGE